MKSIKNVCKINEVYRQINNNKIVVLIQNVVACDDESDGDLITTKIIKHPNLSFYNTTVDYFQYEFFDYFEKVPDIYEDLTRILKSD